tara:strand:- start:55 stop:894 length:840 start_codon:yes stop_codon:yes gene_type:complete
MATTTSISETCGSSTKVPKATGSFITILRKARIPEIILSAINKQGLYDISDLEYLPLNELTRKFAKDEFGIDGLILFNKFKKIVVSNRPKDSEEVTNSKAQTQTHVNRKSNSPNPDIGKSKSKPHVNKVSVKSNGSRSPSRKMPLEKGQKHSSELKRSSTKMENRNSKTVSKVNKIPNPKSLKHRSNESDNNYRQLFKECQRLKQKTEDAIKDDGFIVSDDEGEMQLKKELKRKYIPQDEDSQYLSDSESYQELAAKSWKRSRVLESPYESENENCCDN